MEIDVWFIFNSIIYEVGYVGETQKSLFFIFYLLKKKEDVYSIYYNLQLKVLNLMRNTDTLF